MNIAVAGAGYVGLSNAVLLAQHNNIAIVDIMPERVAAINEKRGYELEKEQGGYRQGFGVMKRMEEICIL